MNEKRCRKYFGILGIVTLIFGIADLVVTSGGSSFFGAFLRCPVIFLLLFSLVILFFVSKRGKAQSFYLKIKGVSKSENFNNFYLNTSW